MVDGQANAQCIYWVLACVRSKSCTFLLYIHAMLCITLFTEDNAQLTCVAPVTAAVRLYCMRVCGAFACFVSLKFSFSMTYVECRSTAD